jgi:hypothetical protein
MTDELTHKLTDSPTDSVKHCNTETLEREITSLRWALKTKQNIIDRLLRDTPKGISDIKAAEGHPCCYLLTS